MLSAQLSLTTGHIAVQAHLFTGPLNICQPKLAVDLVTVKPIQKACSGQARTLENALRATACVYAAQKYLYTIKNVKLIYQPS